MKLYHPSLHILRTLSGILMLFGLIAFNPVETNAKKNQSSDDVVIVTLDRQPSFPGGDSVMFQWIEDNLRLPPSFDTHRKRGLVVVDFMVQPDGTLTDLRLSKKFNEEANAEALRLVASMPTWEPGMHGTRAVAVPMSVPITFNKKIEKKAEEKETFATWLDGKINKRKSDKADATKEEVTPPAVAQASTTAEEVPAGPVYFVDGVRFYGDPATIKLADIDTFSEVKSSEEFPNGCIYITLKNKK